MRYQATTALKKIRRCKKRLRIIQGGSSAGKTIATLLILIDLAQREGGKVISVVSETLPHLKKGAIRDFLAIMEAHGYYDDDRWNRTDYIYTFETGSKIEFFGADSPDKVRGPRRDHLFINEANNISYETFTQLSIRTNGTIWVDYNPVVEFWVHDEIINRGADHDFLILTYKDNEGLPPTIVADLESRKGNTAWWRVYGEGLVGELEGRVYKGWQIIDEIPHGARLERHALDFGFDPDPAVIVDIYYYDGGYILDEVLYQKGLHNSDLAQALKNLPSRLTIADSAEPKSISEIAMYGVSIMPTPKGKDSKKWGISVMQSIPISITKRSVNGIDEYRKYMLDQDKEGRFIAGETVGHDDFLDAARYGICSIVPVIQRADIIANMPHVLDTRERKNPAR
jgi:phage terminase large subunit